MLITDHKPLLSLLKELTTIPITRYPIEDNHALTIQFDSVSMVLVHF